LELDLVAESEDGRTLLLGEVEWADEIDTPRLVAELRRKAQRIPFRENRDVRLALWTRKSARLPREVRSVAPRQVLEVLR
jgi:hypothetical protein